MGFINITRVRRRIGGLEVRASEKPGMRLVRRRIV